MLTDKFGRPMRDLRISVTDRCNFRCPYCMPAEIYGEAYEFLPRADILTFEELTRLVGFFAELGVTKLRVTGGEPLMRNELPQLINMLNGVSGIEDLTLTTNGYLLSQFAQQLVLSHPGDEGFLFALAEKDIHLTPENHVGVRAGLPLADEHLPRLVTDAAAAERQQLQILSADA